MLCYCYCYGLGLSGCEHMAGLEAALCVADGLLVGGLVDWLMDR